MLSFFLPTNQTTENTTKLSGPSGFVTFFTKALNQVANKFVQDSTTVTTLQLKISRSLVKITIQVKVARFLEMLTQDLRNINILDESTHNSVWVYVATISRLHVSVTFTVRRIPRQNDSCSECCRLYRWRGRRNNPAIKLPVFWMLRTVQSRITWRLTKAVQRHLCKVQEIY